MIALTGYTGFVGQKLLAQLAEPECILLGRHKLNAEHHFCKLDLASINQVALFESLQAVTTLVHLAARVHVMNDKANDPLAEFRSLNTQATLEIATQAAKAGVKRFVFLSSIKVNGERTVNDIPFTSEDKPAPEDAYGMSKLEAEQQLITLGKQTGMEIVIIRAPLVYGEGVKANFAALMKAVGEGFLMPFRAISNNKRSLVSVYNLVDLIIVCMEHPKAANQLFLVSDDDDLSTSQVVSLMAKVQGKKMISLPVPAWCFRLVGRLINKNNVVEKLIGSLQLDITHTKNTLDWTPPYSVEQGFKLTANRQ